MTTTSATANIKLPWWRYREAPAPLQSAVLTLQVDLLCVLNPVSSPRRIFCDLSVFLLRRRGIALALQDSYPAIPVVCIAASIRYVLPVPGYGGAVFRRGLSSHPAAGFLL